ncbi:MAG: type II toxin-antitoxin system Phd/YefM family antitoxin [Cardiobacterium sp.]
MTTISSRYFNQHTSKVQKAAEQAPVIITNRGEPSHVLMSIADFRRLTGEAVEMPPRTPRPGSLLEYLMNADHPDVSDIELEIPPRSKAQRRPVEF